MIKKFIQSKDCNKNYLAKVVRLSGVKKHANADRLQTCVIDFNQVIFGTEYKDGDVCVYFPVECQINKDFISFLNGFSSPTLNKDTTKKGFFDNNARVRAVKLRGERSCGFIIDLESFELFFGSNIQGKVGDEFDYVGDIKVCNKYVIHVPQTFHQKAIKKARISRLVDKQFNFHVDTENLRRNAHMIHPNDYISISYKLHGTSAIFSNVLAKKKMSMVDRLVSLLYKNVNNKEYDLFYSSRMVVKNQFETINKPGYYKQDIWGIVKEEIKDKIPKGFTLYGEIVGFLPGGGAIQKGYDYGCEKGEHEFYVYRITITNEDGYVINLSTADCVDFCNANDLNFVPTLYCGYAEDVYEDIAGKENWNENFVLELEKEHTNHKCGMCINDVPCEGVVVRKDCIQNFEVYKLKSTDFLEYETKLLDDGVVDLESTN